MQSTSCSSRPEPRMTDVFTKGKRSDVMSKIKGRGNRSTELKFASLLKAHRITGWRRHLAIPIVEPKRTDRVHNVSPKKRKSKVRPDFVFRAERLAVFIDGCFWHGCPKHAVWPKSNDTFWAAKLSANRQRDQLVTRCLRRRRWKVLRIWEHDLISPNSVYLRLAQYLSSDVPS